MAEFCSDCQKRMHPDQTPAWGYRLTREKELCEGCGEYKRIVLDDYGWNWLWQRAQIYLFLILAMSLFFFLRWLILLPIKAYRRRKTKKQKN